jgi:hypothetical protein
MDPVRPHSHCQGLGLQPQAATCREIGHAQVQLSPLMP